MAIAQNNSNTYSHVIIYAVGSRFLYFLKFFIGWPLSFIAIFFILRLIAPKTNLILPKLAQINPLLLIISLLFFVIYFFLRSYFWKEVLKAKGYNLSFKETAYLWQLSEIKRYIPGNVWSFLGRAVLFGEKGIPKKIVVSSILIEIQFLIVSSALIASFSFSYFFTPLMTFIYKKEILINFFAAAVILGSFIYLFSSLWSLRLKNSKNKIIKLAAYFFPTFTISTNLRLLFIALTYMLFFCMGTYFAISSIFILPYEYTFILVSFFALSFLIAYLSLVTPSGIGVRETIMTIGLSKLITVSAAGFTAIFSRVILIFSELIFFALVIIWQNTAAVSLNKFKNYIKIHYAQITLTLFIVLYISYFSIASFLRFDNFYAGRFDLGNMDQTVWNTIHGKIFQLTNPDGTEIVSRLAIHADFILILLSPLYLVWEDPRMLLLIQTIIISIGALFIYLISKKILNSKILSLTFSIAYLLNPSVQYANLYDFHAVTLATTFLLAAFYFIFNKRYALFLLFAFLSAITKEQVWLTIALFGAYLFLVNIKFFTKKLNFNKAQILGVGVFLVSTAIFFFLVFYAIPNARRADHFAFSYFQKLGSTPSGITKNVLLNPVETAQIILEEEKVDYVYKLLSPLGFLSFAQPFYLVFALPDLLIGLLSQNRNFYQIYYQYTATITPFIFISAIFGINQLRKIRFYGIKIPLVFFELYLISAILYSSYSFGPLPGAKKPSTDMLLKTQNNKNKIKEIISKIPKNHKVASTNNLGAHLSQRDYIFTLPLGIDTADSVVILHGDATTGLSLIDEKSIVENLKIANRYKVVYQQNNFILLEKSIIPN